MKQPEIMVKRIPHIVYTVEDNAGTTYTAHINEEETRYAGELMAEFSPELTVYLVPHTLN